MRTELLKQAIDAMERLPADAQDAVATRLLAELADEEQWRKQFESTSDAQWDRMADEVRTAIRAGQTMPLEDVLKPDTSG